jgi:hypothetical protein
MKKIEKNRKKFYWKVLYFWILWITVSLGFLRSFTYANPWSTKKEA